MTCALPIWHVETRGTLDEWEDIDVRQALIDVGSGAFILEGVHHVKAEHALGSPEPAQLRDVAVARHRANPALAAHLVHPVIAPSLQARRVAGGRIDREQRVT